VRFFTILGVIFAIVGAFFLFQTLQTYHPDSQFDIGVMHEAAPILALVFLPIGLIFAVVGLLVGRSVANRQKLIDQGLVGQATVMEAAETGMYVNERPMVKLTLNVMAAGRPPYTVEHSEAIPLIALGMITPGSILPVAIDPAGPEKLAIDWSGETQARATSPMAGGYGVPPATPGTMPMPNTLSTMGSAAAAANTLQPQAPGVVRGTTGGEDVYQAQLAALRDSGFVGRAVIKSVEDLGVVIEGDKVERFELDVTPNARAMYSVQHSGYVPAALAHRAMAGAGVVVYIDRANPQNLVIDWAAG
jgi:hypothetical protein